MQKRVRVDDNWVLARGQKVHGPRWFRVEEYLGRGAFAAAYRATDADGEEYFLKEYLPPEHPGQHLERRAVYRQERRVLMRVSGHELCPTLHAAFAECGCDYLVQDFVHGRDIEGVLSSGETRGEARILRWAVCLTRAVAHLHVQRIVHQDLKPANIRLNLDDDPVLLDFGAARDFTLEDDSPAEYGTDGYMPPERATAGERGLAAGRQADVFALGVILVEAMIGQRLSQEEINAQRYPSAREMLDDRLVIAPPVGRVDRRFLDFGRVELGVPLRRPVTAFNAGGGLLPIQVEVVGDWLQVSEPGGHGASRRTFASNRQPLVVTALPERIPRRGVPVEGEVRFIFPSGKVRVRCSIEHPLLPADVSVTPSSLQIRPGPLGRASAALTFRNRGELPASISLRASPPQGIRFEPAELELDAAEATALVIWHSNGSQAEQLRDWLQSRRRPPSGRAEYLLEWRLNGARGGFIPLEVVTVGSLARAVASRLLRVAAEHGLGARGHGSEDLA